MQQMTLSNFAAFSKIIDKAWYFMRIVCWQTILLKIIPYFFRKFGKMSENLSSAAVVSGALGVKYQNLLNWLIYYWNLFWWPWSNCNVTKKWVGDIIEPWHEICNNVVCATSKGSDQPAHMRSLIRAFSSHLNILWLLNYWLIIIWSLWA